MSGRFEIGGVTFDQWEIESLGRHPPLLAVREYDEAVARRGQGNGMSRPRV